MQISRFVLAIAASMLFVAGCASQKTPAKHAVEKIENSLAQVKSEAAMYAPDELKEVEFQLAKLNATLASKHYDDVLASAPQVEQKVASLPAAIDEGKVLAVSAAGFAKAQWASMSTELPAMVDTIQARVDALAKAKALPAGVTKEGVASAKSVLNSMKSMLAEASADAKRGNAVAAAGKGKTIKGMGEELFDQLDIDKA
jgi:hypothetical protein